MKLCEALYFAFVIGKRGTISRCSWGNSKSIDECVHCSNEDDPHRYLFLSDNINYNVVLNDMLKDKIQRAVRGVKVIDPSFGLPITKEDLRAEDWKVDDLMYIGSRFLEEN